MRVEHGQDVVHRARRRGPIRAGHVVDRDRGAAVRRDEAAVVGGRVVDHAHRSRLGGRGEGACGGRLAGGRPHRQRRRQVEDGDRGLLVAVDAEGAQHLQVCFVGGLAGNRQPLGQLAADAKRCERAGGGQAKPDENDDLLVVQRPTSDGAHGDSFASTRTSRR